MGNRKPRVIHRTSITSSASSLPMFHQFTLLKAGRLHSQHSTEILVSLRIKYCSVFIKSLGLTRITTSHPNSNGIANRHQFCWRQGQHIEKLALLTLGPEEQRSLAISRRPHSPHAARTLFTKAVLFPSVPSFAGKDIAMGCGDVCEQFIKEFKFAEGC